MNKPTIDFKTFYPYEPLCEQIRALAAWQPERARCHVIGKSAAGRDILMLDVSNDVAGNAKDKPAYLVHGNIHAGEVSGSACALYLAHHLLANAETDPAAKELMNNIVFHIIPRVCVDGAEDILLRRHHIRSRETVKKCKNCIQPQDINGDGFIHSMRVPDPNGPLFAPDDEPRLLLPPMPGDKGGRRYRLTIEGMIHDWDGGPWQNPATTITDFNRNWPFAWQTRHQVPGAGRYPFSEPEVRAVADFTFDHPHIFGMFGLHNGTNAILRPPTSTGDTAMNNADLLAFRRLAALGAKITGFPPKAVHEYRNKLAAPISLYGAFTEWGYNHCGLFAMEIELGNLYNSVGWDTEKIFSITPEGERQRERDCLTWHDAHPEAGIFADWQPFDHPQLGPVEIGGIIPEAFCNVIADERIATWEKTRQFIFALAVRGPRLEIADTAVTPLGGNLYQVDCRVINEGYLPTHVTSIGAGLSHIDGVAVEIERPATVAFIAGRNRTELGHLQASEYRDLRWVLKAPPATAITLQAHAPRAGKARAQVMLKS